MLCQVCSDMLRGSRGRVWAGTLDLTFEHHKAITSLQCSAEVYCPICRSLYTDVASRGDKTVNIRAILKKVSPAFNERKGLTYRLDFDMGSNHTRTFLLKESGMVGT